LTNPITRIAGCCASAAIGQSMDNAAAPLHSVMNLRRIMEYLPVQRIIPYHAFEPENVLQCRGLGDMRDRCSRMPDAKARNRYASF